MTIRNRIRRWLFGDEIDRLVLMERDLRTVHTASSMILADTTALRSETTEGFDKVIKLLEPQVARLRAGQRAPGQPDWDQVQQQNLKQFEE